MRMTVPQIAASRTQRAVADLTAAARSTQPDKVTWVPLGDARTILDQLTECAIANLKWRGILQTRQYAEVSPELWERTVAECTTLESTLKRLEQSGAELVAAIQAVPDEETGDEIESPWGRYTIADCCLHAYWNMVYHEGQINYVQTLYGDTEEHY
jgi:uncharacterized damage-inducible protein DinB